MPIWIMLILIIIVLVAMFVLFLKLSVLFLQGITRQEVINYQFLGFNNEDIAKQLNLSVSAIEWHLQKAVKSKDGEG